RSLVKCCVPVGPRGQAEFLGELCATPIVTSVQIICGTDVLFTVDGVTSASVGTDTSPHNLVATDDFVYAEPTTAANAQPVIAATAGLTFNGLVATFSDLDPNGVVGNFTAVIDWGDGHISPGVISANANGGFNINGSNTYAAGGRVPVTIDIADVLGSKLTLNNTAAATAPGQVLH